MNEQFGDALFEKQYIPYCLNLISFINYNCNIRTRPLPGGFYLLMSMKLHVESYKSSIVQYSSVGCLVNLPLLLLILEWIINNIESIIASRYIYIYIYVYKQGIRPKHENSFIFIQHILSFQNIVNNTQVIRVTVILQFLYTCEPPSSEVQQITLTTSNKGSP